MKLPNKRKIVLIDNYDSFTYNLVDQINRLISLGLESKQTGKYAKTELELVVFRNDSISASDVIKLNPAGVIISPGPGSPTDGGICLDLLLLLSETQIPLLGVCLGHQIIVHSCLGKIKKADMPIHGKKSLVYHNKSGLFKGIESPMIAARYHSLCSSDIIPEELTVTSWCKKGVTIPDKQTEILSDSSLTDDPYLKNRQIRYSPSKCIVMGVAHKQLPWFGVQFHPESFLTKNGDKLINSFIDLVYTYALKSS